MYEREYEWRIEVKGSGVHDRSTWSLPRYQFSNIRAAGYDYAILIGGDEPPFIYFVLPRDDAVRLAPGGTVSTPICRGAARPGTHGSELWEYCCTNVKSQFLEYAVRDLWLL